MGAVDWLYASVSLMAIIRPFHDVNLEDTTYFGSYISSPSIRLPLGDIYNLHILQLYIWHIRTHLRYSILLQNLVYSALLFLSALSEITATLYNYPICDSVSSIDKGPDGQIWLGCMDAGYYQLVRFSPTQRKIVQSIDFGPGNSYRVKAINIDQDTADIYAVAETSSGFNGQSMVGGIDIVLIKYNSAGTVQWTRIFGSVKDDSVSDVKVDSTNGYVYVGGATNGKVNNPSYTLATHHPECYVSKFRASDGVHVWTEQEHYLNGCILNALLVDPLKSSDIYAVGQVYGEKGMIMSFYASSGNKKAYNHVIVHGGYAMFTSAVFDSTGSKIFAAGALDGSVGSVSSSGSGTDCWVAQYSTQFLSRSSDGFVFGSSSNDQIEDIVMNPQTGSLWATGWISGSIGSGTYQGLKDGVLLNINPTTLDLVSAETFNTAGSNNEQGLSLIFDSYGQINIAAMYGSAGKLLVQDAYAWSVVPFPTTSTTTTTTTPKVTTTTTTTPRITTTTTTSPKTTTTTTTTSTTTTTTTTTSTTTTTTTTTTTSTTTTTTSTTTTTTTTPSTTMKTTTATTSATPFTSSSKFTSSTLALNTSTVSMSSSLTTSSTAVLTTSSDGQQFMETSSATVKESSVIIETSSTSITTTSSAMHLVSTSSIHSTPDLPSQVSSSQYLTTSGCVFCINDVSQRSSTSTLTTTGDGDDPSALPQDQPQSLSSNIVQISAVVVAIVVILIMSLCLIIAIRKRKARQVVSKLLQGSVTSTQASTQYSLSSIGHHTVLQTQGQTTMMSTSYAIYIPAFLKFDFGMDYQVLNLVATGGTSKIYFANTINPKLAELVQGSPVIAKVSNTVISEMSQKQTDSFYQELSLLWKFRDVPYITKLYGYSDQLQAVMLMKYYPLGALSDFVESRGNAPLQFRYSKRQTLLLMKLLAQTLAFIHKSQIIHCDLKPQNVLLDSWDGQTLVPVLSDFGISHITDNAASLQVQAFQVSKMRGLSLLYAAPEVMFNFRNRTPEGRPEMLKAGDVYAFSIIMYNMITRYEPWSLIY